MKTIKMTRAQHKLWTDALRSGDYHQYIGGALEGETDAGISYCCLGVLQKVISGDVEHYSYGEARMFPSQEWLIKYNIKFSNSFGDPYATTPDLGLPGNSASILNDRGVSFVDIADLIDAHVEFTD